MNNFLDNRNDTRSGYEFQASQGYVKKQFIDSPVDDTTTYVHAAITTAAVITTGITNPDVARLVTIVGTGSDHDAAGIVTIIGTDIRGNIISDALTLNSNTVVPSIKAFATVTSIDTSACTAIDSNATISVGVSDALGLARELTEDSVLFATFGGVYEATRPTVVTNATDVSQNVATLNTDLDGSSDVVICYVTSEQVNAA